MIRSYVYQCREEKSINNDDLVNLMVNVFQKGGSLRFCASGASMWPFIRNGDIITLMPSRKKNLENGDIVAFVSDNNNKLTIHRIIAKRDNSYLIKGDNTSSPDGWVQNEKILGVVAEIEHNGRIVSYIGIIKGLISYTSRVNLLQIFTRMARKIFLLIIKVRNRE